MGTLRREGRHIEANLLAEIRFLEAIGATQADLLNMETIEDGGPNILKGLQAIFKYFINGNTPEFIMVYFNPSKNGNNNLMMDVWYNGDRNSHRINVTEKSREPLSKAIEYLRTGHEYKLPIGFNG